MKRLPFYLTVLLLWMGTACSSTGNSAKTPTAECPKQPQSVLQANQVKFISPGTDGESLSGIINKDRSQAYAFEAQAGQRLEYETKDDICIWVYTPDNQLIETKDLPATGKYIIQIAVPQGSKTFELVVRLETTTGTKANRSSPPPLQPDFSRANFRKRLAVTKSQPIQTLIRLNSIRFISR